ncbi:MAG: archease [Candidatus Omnitrophica bacterium]|nr:archease [Candidatus Omnitrophota bacterium]
MCSSPRTAEFSYFDHEADIGVLSQGASPQEAFCSAAQATWNVIADLSTVEPLEELVLECEAPTAEELLVEWLNRLLAEADIRGWVFCEFRIESWSSGRLVGRALGEVLDMDKHRMKSEVKAATYCENRVWEEGGRWFCRFVIDV